MTTSIQTLFNAVDFYRKTDAEAADTWHGAWSRRDSANVVVAAALAMVDDARKTSVLVSSSHDPIPAPPTPPLPSVEEPIGAQPGEPQDAQEGEDEEPAVCPWCSGQGCGSCGGTGEVYRKRDVDDLPDDYDLDDRDEYPGV